MTPAARPRRIPVVVQARMGSTRLPGKVLMRAGGRTKLEILVERLRRAERVDRVVLATSDRPADRAIVEEAERLGVPWFAGDEHDVLSRYLGAARGFDLPALVRITADCPLTDPAIVDAVVARFVEAGADYASNVAPRSHPVGFDVEAISREALERAGREETRPEIREHVTLHVARSPDRFVHAPLAHPAAAYHLGFRFTLDNPEDYDLLRAVYEALYPDHPRFALGDVLSLVERDPRVAALHRAAREVAAKRTGGAA